MKRALLVSAIVAASFAVALPAAAEPAVDADRYRADDGYAFLYRYDGGKRVCTIEADPTTLRCGISAPAGTRITVKNRTVRPEAVEVTERGWRYLDKLSVQERPRELPAGARLSVHGASCTALRDGGLECSVDSTGFTQDDGRFSTRGRKLG
ncbi:hypothetical protein [Tsukamurella ocularis]|uniref:hypothetical protein n=1 Tax=Tsukamurella ocularis TaxID=1970234 RepID=UPI0021694FBB|nr:hypothetical protein [Tsukamurella ocularis]MCS3779571.1 hypothetical protein [Tsukamurella ocularis]MCS3789029.1 hypothetical protein [Tsukamurella ocularis]MCS3850239.1 hypothetical protein [Tsukamurella ocularis]